MMNWMLMTVMADVETSILPGGMCIMEILLLVLKVLIYGLGVAATVGVVIAGIQYMTARDSEAQVANAKKRILEIVIGLAAWALMWTVLNWLVPGGMSLGLDGRTHDEICASAGTASEDGTKTLCRL